jgi:hypothetical protein
VVFTTYQTVEREKRSNKRNKPSLFSHHWKRIILDEGIASCIVCKLVWGACADTHLAHMIRNYNTSTARAVAALQATSRWALSGTPIQNSLTDFLGLFKFLHFVPYDDLRVFDDEISNLWRDKPTNEAVETFKKLLSCVMIRRTKSILELPKREDKIVRLSFTNLEQEHYRRFERPMVEMLDQAAKGKSNPNHFWLSAIQQINRLRLVCNLGTFMPMNHAPLIESSGSDSRLAVLTARLSVGGETCGQCLQAMEFSPSEDKLLCSNSSNIYYSACHRLFCAGCSTILRYRTPEPCACTASLPSCPLLPLLPLQPLLSAQILPPPCVEMANSGEVSSKVRALISQINAHPREKQ